MKRRERAKTHRPRTSDPGPRQFRVGQRATITFSAMNLEGAAVASTGIQQIAVPFAIPREEALVEITRGGSQAEGKILTILRKSQDAASPRCRHFGRCGGCQWQHMSYEAQLRHKTSLVRHLLAPLMQRQRVSIRDAVGSSPWEYRNRIQAAFDVRGERVVAGYYAMRDPASANGDEHQIINVQECPIQHPDNVRLLAAVRDAIVELGWPVYDRHTGEGLVRGMIGQAGFTSGEAMVVLSATRELPDRMAFVHAVRRRILNLTSLVLSVQPLHTPELLGRIDLLWGRLYLEDEIAGLALRLYPTAAVPPNPRALPLWLQAIERAAQASPDAAVFDAACEEGLVPIALAKRGARVIGVAPDREAMHRAWENARLNEVDTVVFYTRAPAGVLAKLRARGERFHSLVTNARGASAPAALITETKRSGIRRLVYTSHSPSRLAADTQAALDAGFRLVEIQPVDLLPQTSRIHCVATLVSD